MILPHNFHISPYTKVSNVSFSTSLRQVFSSHMDMVFLTSQTYLVLQVAQPSTVLPLSKVHMEKLIFNSKDLVLQITDHNSRFLCSQQRLRGVMPSLIFISLKSCLCVYNSWCNRNKIQIHVGEEKRQGSSGEALRSMQGNSTGS